MDNLLDIHSDIFHILGTKRLHLLIDSTKKLRYLSLCTYSIETFSLKILDVLHVPVILSLSKTKISLSLINPTLHRFNSIINCTNTIIKYSLKLRSISNYTSKAIRNRTISTFTKSLIYLFTLISFICLLLHSRNKLTIISLIALSKFLIKFFKRLLLFFLELSPLTDGVILTLSLFRRKLTIISTLPHSEFIKKFLLPLIKSSL